VQLNCPSCGAQVHGRFCPACGREVTKPAAQRGGWFYVAGGLVLALVFALGVLVGRGGRPEQDPGGMSAGAPVQAPDISNLSPRERFDRLYDRVMQASTSGDAATMQRFSPMAISAYAMLDSVDIDARYDVAVIKLHAGDVPGATALADTIIAQAPTHLFGWMLRATVARFGGDSTGAKRAGATFLRHYPTELAKALPEYAEHRTSLEAFKRQLDQAR
jgi:hypothetical protein